MKQEGRVLTWVALARELKKKRSQGRKIVFTNGCFDLIHLGHLKIFRECKKLGDVLVVGLNSDSSVRWLKGPTRPIIRQNDRAELIAGLSPVDYVCLFSDPTPKRLIELVRPDVLVKGGDWKADAIVGREVAKKVVRVPLVKGRSTTALIDRILSLNGHARGKNSD